MLAWIAASLFTLIKGDLSVFAFFEFFDADLIIVFTVLLIVFYGEIKVGLFAYVQGLLIDILSTGVLGLHALIYLIVFVSIKLGSYLFDLQHARGHFIMVTLAVLLKGVISVAFLYIFSWRAGLTSYNLLSITTSAVFSGLMAYFISYFIFRFKEGTYFYHEKDNV